MEKIKVPALNGFVGSMVKVQSVNGVSRDLETIAEFANPSIRRDDQNPYSSIPSGRISLRHPEVENYSGDKISIFEMYIDHFYQRNGFDGDIIYTGRISSMMAYKEFPDFSDEDAVRSTPPNVDEFKNLDVIITVSPIHSKKDSNRAVKHLGS